ncbi:MAG: T9SS type A sorting domain-containing protein [Crocinitomicaceae bacterium]
MKRNLQFLFVSAFMACTGVSFAQSAEMSPDAGTFVASDDRAQFDVQYQYNIGATGSIGQQALAGIALINNEFIVSQWNTDSMWVLNFDGTRKAGFVVQGVTGIRSITYDGTSVYMGGAGTSIYQVDPSDWSLINVINITTTSNAESRMCTYDETLDGGNGGFWIGDFGSDIASVSMTGAELSVIPSATHGLATYGGAFDNYSPDGPWLWVFSQTGANTCEIVQVDPSTGVPTGVSLDYFTSAMMGTTSSLAGGLYISNESVNGTNSFIGLGQSTPSNEIFSLELTASSASISKTESLSLELYPNPATDMVRVSSNDKGNMNVAIHDITGKNVMSTVLSNNNQIDVSNLTTGIYLVKVSQNGATSTKKLVVE